MKLINPNDEELNAAFAEKVAGWKNCCSRSMLGDAPNMDFGYDENVSITEFTHSMDAVLPWMFGKTWSAQEHLPGFGYTVEVRHESIGEVSGRSSGEGSCLPRAAVIALLRAHGVEVIFK